jgi:hypothetical protein
MRFMEAPKATAIKMFATTPEVKEVSMRENAFPMTRIKAKVI